MEDEDLEFETSSQSFIRRLFIFDVFKKYGIVYGLVAIVFFLCNIIIFIPIVCRKSFEFLNSIINLISGGDKVIADCYWAYLVVSLVGIIAIWITIKLCDKLLCTKKTRTN